MGHFVVRFIIQVGESIASRDLIVELIVEETSIKPVGERLTGELSLKEAPAKQQLVV